MLVLRSRSSDERGVLLLGVLLVVILIGYAVISAMPVKPTEVRREREGDLAFKLKEL